MNKLCVPCGAWSMLLTCETVQNVSWHPWTILISSIQKHPKRGLTAATADLKSNLTPAEFVSSANFTPGATHATGNRIPLEDTSCTSDDHVMRFSNENGLSYSLPMIFSPLLNMLAAVWFQDAASPRAWRRYYPNLTSRTIWNPEHYDAVLVSLYSQGSELFAAFSEYLVCNELCSLFWSMCFRCGSVPLCWPVFCSDTLLKDRTSLTSSVEENTY